MSRHEPLILDSLAINLSRATKRLTEFAHATTTGQTLTFTLIP